MRRSLEDLRDFHDRPTGALMRRLLAERLADAWGEATDRDVLGLGYATPWLGAFDKARRTVAAMPGGQGAEPWPHGGRSRVVLVDEHALPFAAGAFDRILMVHALEEADDAQGLLMQAVRVLAPAGRMILAVAARGGLWSRVESTPLGHGRPFSRGQLERLVRTAGLEPTAWSQTLYTPPWTPALALADGFEGVGPFLMPGTAGLIMLEATRREYAPIRPLNVAERLIDRVGDLAPRPATRSHPQKVSRTPPSARRGAPGRAPAGEKATL